MSEWVVSVLCACVDAHVGVRVSAFVCVCAFDKEKERERERERERVCVCVFKRAKFTFERGVVRLKRKREEGCYQNSNLGYRWVPCKCIYACAYVHKCACVRFKDRMTVRASVYTYEYTPEKDGLAPEKQLRVLHRRKQTPSSCTETSPPPLSIRYSLVLA